MLHNYIIHCYPSVLKDAITLQKKKKRLIKTRDPSDLFLKGFKYNKWDKIYKNESKSQPEETIAERAKLRRQKENDENLCDMPLLEGDEEVVKEGKGVKILTPNKLLNRLPILLAQIKAGKQFTQLKK